MNYRNWLWTSALHPFINKENNWIPDVWVIDLEDSVPIHSKQQAREAIIPWFQETENFIKGLRINSLASPEGLKDILFILNNRIEPDVIVIPKITDAAEVRIIDSLLNVSNQKTMLCATIETLKGLDNLSSIIRVSTRLFSLIFGAADFAAELDVPMNWDALLYARQRIAIAASQANMVAIDAPCFSLHDNTQLKKECLMAKMLGFKGKAAIHPQQIESINEVFSISSIDLQKAKSIIQKVKHSKTGIACLEGQMIGPPLVAQAYRLIEAMGETYE